MSPSGAHAPQTLAKKPSVVSTVLSVLVAFLLVRLMPRMQDGQYGTSSTGERPVPSAATRAKSSDASLRESTQSGRGRQAVSPPEIPRLGWKDILWRVYKEMNEHRILAVAGGVTYFGLLSLFPAIAALVAIYGLFADTGAINDHLAALSGLLPGGAVEVIEDQVKRIASKSNTTSDLPFSSDLASPSGVRIQE